MNNLYPNQPQSPQQITVEVLQTMLVEALSIGNRPLLEAINQNSQRLSAMEAAHRDLSSSTLVSLTELKNILKKKNAQNKPPALEKQLQQLTAALNTLNSRQAQLLSSMNSLSEQLKAESVVALDGHSEEIES